MATTKTATKKSPKTSRTRRVRGYLQDGSFVLIPKAVLADFVGIDEYDNPIIRMHEAPFEGELMGITNCCGATGKGLTNEATDEGDVGCRACYRPVSEALGGTFAESDIYLKAR
jgi:hypothetical protein